MIVLIESVSGQMLVTTIPPQGQGVIIIHKLYGPKLKTNLQVALHSLNIIHLKADRIVLHINILFKNIKLDFINM